MSYEYENDYEDIDELYELYDDDALEYRDDEYDDCIEDDDIVPLINWGRQPV